MCDLLWKPHLSENEGEPIYIENYASSVGQLIFFATKLGPNLENASRALSYFMSNKGDELLTELDGVIGNLKGVTFKKIYMLS